MIWKIVLVISLVSYVKSESDAVSEQRVTLHHVKSEHSESKGDGKNSEYRKEYAWSYPSYEFSYKVNDPETHDIKGQHEKRDGDEVKGLYWLIEPNGHKRTVNYQADDHKGFNAQIHITEGKNLNEYKSNNENEEKLERKIAEVREPENEIKIDENNNNGKEQESINDQQSVNEKTDVVETVMDNQNDVNAQNNGENVETENRTNMNENDNNNQGGDNNAEKNNEKSKRNCCTYSYEDEKSVNSEAKSKEKNVDYNNRRKKRVNTNRSFENRNKSKSSEYANTRINQKNYRHVSGNDQNYQRHDKQVKQESEKKENSYINAGFKNNSNEKKEQTNKYEERLLPLNSLEDLSRNVEDNKSEKFEHRIRIHHPKTVFSKS